MSLDILIPQSQFKPEPNHLQILNGYDYYDDYCNNYTVHVGAIPC